MISARFHWTVWLGIILPTLVGCNASRKHPALCEDPATACSPAQSPDGGPPLGVVDPTREGTCEPLGSPCTRDRSDRFTSRRTIELENQRPGDRGWGIGPNHGLGAFCDRSSYFPGESAVIRAAAPVATTARWELWRIGYYAGVGARKITSGGPVSIQATGSVVMDPNTGAVRETWSESFRIAIDPTAVTGFYLVKVMTSRGSAYATFVLREIEARAPIVYPVAVNTYQAYNIWGGTSLYGNRRPDWPRSHAYAVSFDRPYASGGGAGELFNQDVDFIYFAESQGYDIAYATDLDLDEDEHLLDRRSLVVVQGHSEYWTAGMREHVERAIAQGTDVAFLGANNVYWQVRYAPGATGTARRTMIGYKEFAALDPFQSSDPAHVTTKWRDPPVSKPENALCGGMYGDWIRASSPLFVQNPDSWLWRGAGVSEGTLIPGVYGVEIDRRFANGFEPPRLGVLGWTIGESYKTTFGGGNTTLYIAPSGARVFDAGSIVWSRGLAREGRWDRRIQQATANIFSVLVGDGQTAVLKPMELPTGQSAPNYRGGVQVSTVTMSLAAPSALAFGADGKAYVVDGSSIVRVDSAGNAVQIAGSAAGFADGPALQAQFQNPRGIVAAPDGTLYVADTGNHAIRAILPNGIVRTLAGAGSGGFADGVGAAARFSFPTGIARTASGTLLVADTWNHRIRSIAPDGTVATVAGTGVDGTSLGAGRASELSFPSGLTLLPNGTAVFTEPSAGNLRAMAPTGDRAISIFAGAAGRQGWNDGPLETASVSDTVGLASLPNGDLTLLDAASARVRVVANGTIQTLAGGSAIGTADGEGVQAGFIYPRAAAVAPDGSVWVVDVGAHSLRRVVLR